MGERPPRPRVFSIPPAAPFLHTLADAFLAGRFGAVSRDDPLALAAATVLLPTRRAVRAFREILVDRLGRAAAILPTIRPIGDVDEEDHLLAPAAESPLDRLAVPPAVSALSRRIELTRLILAWRRAVLANPSVLLLAPDEPILVPASLADATRLAADLARLIDDMETAGIAWERIRSLAPDDHARYFQMTLKFLEIAFDYWPQRLQEIGRADPAARRDRLIRAEAARLTANPPAHPVIAAGSTGSIPATAALLKAIASLPNGAVVLPGLDRDLDEAGWRAIGGRESGEAAPGHPQYGMRQLIAEIGVARDEVEVIGAVSAEGAARQRLLSEALRPAETTDAWAAARDRGLAPAAVEASLVGLDLLIARNEREEALAVALAVRKALADGLATIAVVTPDRGIGRRVAAELGRFGLAIDDSAGAPLDSLPAGIFARLLVEAVAADGDAVALLALLKHPFACFGLGHAHCRAAARALERAVLRGRRVVGGIAALGEALAAARSAPADAGHAPVSRQGLSPGDWDLAVNLVSALGATLLPLKEALAASGPVSAAALTRLLIPAIQSAARDEGGSDAALWAGRAGEGLAELLAGLAGSEADALELAPAEYADFLGALMGEIVVAPEPGADPRVHIWGTLEARLQSVDFLVLAGLDEGVWPQDVRTDAFLSRAMRAELGLAAPERRIGLAAHDFAAGMAAPRVLVTRAEKRGGAPTVESRWLQRLTAFIGPEARQALAARGRAYGAIADVLDRSPPGAVRSAPRPRPSPPVAARPRRLSITEIETLIRDPYAVYARHVLGLVPFEPLGVAPDYALRGSLIHEALGRFTAGWTGPYAAAAEEALLQIGAEVLSEIAGFPDIHAVWSLRFRAIAAWFIAWERGRASEIAARHPEIPGRIEIPAPAGAFSLRGRADRIDIRRDGSVEIYDFKTGTPPSARQVLTGFAPQLALEAMMVRDGAFPPVPAGRSLSVLSWIALGQVDRGVALKSAVERDFTADAVAESARAELAALLAAFDDPAREYLSRARPMFETRFEGDYDHLARVREWGLAETGGEGE